MQFKRSFVIIGTIFVALVLFYGPWLGSTYAGSSSTHCFPPGHYLHPRIACTELTGATIKANKIGLPTNGATVTSATLIAPTSQTVNPTTGNIVLATPEYCQVLGAIAPIDPTAPSINFQVSLPTDWNFRSMHFGGGGFNGSVVTGVGTRYPQPLDDPRPITRHYATFGSDSGHTGNNAAFGLNEESLLNFAYEQLKKTKDTAFEIIKLYYGKWPRYSYFNGHSEGAREGHTVVQRYPKDYDGVIAVVPIINEMTTHLHDNAVLTALAYGGWMNQNKINLITNSTNALCDGLDGLVDGIISKYGMLNPAEGWQAACQHDVSVLRCPSGGDEGDSCLSDAQIEAVNVIRDRFPLPFTLANGVTGYVGYGAMGGESNGTAWDTVLIGSQPPPIPQPDGVWSQSAYGVGNIPYYGHTNVRYFIAQDPTFQTYNFDPVPYEARIQYISSILDSINPDISKFLRRGGKLIMKENTCDYHRSTFLGINYYKSLLDKFGRRALDNSVRLYVAVGANHFGSFAPSQADLITLLEDWVEKGKAPPKNIVGVDMDPKTFSILGSRPMCGYGLYPKYKGSGDPNNASSFTCKPL